MAKKRYCDKCGAAESGIGAFIGQGLREHKLGLFCNDCYEEQREKYKQKWA